MFHQFMNIISLWALPAIIILILTLGLIKKVPLYEVFTDGAKEGFKVSVNIIPYLVAIIVGISMFRASGILENFSHIFAPLLEHFKVPADVIPIMLVRSLSGSAALGIFQTLQTVQARTHTLQSLRQLWLAQVKPLFMFLRFTSAQLGFQN